MRLFIGVFCVVISLFMFLIINIASVAFPVGINGEVLAYFTIQFLIYPVVTLILGLCFIGHIMVEDIKKKNS